MDSELAAKILQQVKDKLDTDQVKKIYFRQCGPAHTREASLPFLSYKEWLGSPYITPACNRRINRTWCKGECIGQDCIFWGSSGIGTINLER